MVGRLSGLNALKINHALMGSVTMITEHRRHRCTLDLIGRDRRARAEAGAVAGRTAVRRLDTRGGTESSISNKHSAIVSRLKKQ